MVSMMKQQSMMLVLMTMMITMLVSREFGMVNAAEDCCAGCSNEKNNCYYECRSSTAGAPFPGAALFSCNAQCALKELNCSSSCEGGCPKTTEQCCGDCKQTFFGCAEVCREALSASSVLPEVGRAVAVQCLSLCKTAQDACMALSPCGSCIEQGFGDCCPSCNATAYECYDINSRSGAVANSGLPCTGFESACNAQCSPQCPDSNKCCDGCSEEAFVKPCLRGCFKRNAMCVSDCRRYQGICTGRCGGCGQSGDCCSGCRTTIASCQGVFGAGSSACKDYAESCLSGCPSPCPPP